jgi:catechol 2,3-dioxygenase-like lactoylglutathione lyase family enzyme
MTIKLNHTIVAAHDHKTSAIWLAELFGLPGPAMMGPFAAVQVGDTSLDYMDIREYRGTEDADIASQHYAFLVTEEEFDAIFGRICARQLPFWADPYQRERNHINQWDGGRGVYFEDPNGHLLEIITRPYGSGGTTTTQVHPLFTVAREGERHKANS